VKPKKFMPRQNSDCPNKNYLYSMYLEIMIFHSISTTFVPNQPTQITITLFYPLKMTIIVTIEQLVYSCL